MSEVLDEGGQGMGNTDMVRGAYAAFEVGDVPGVLGVLAEDVEWIEAEGFPTAGTYRGHDEVAFKAASWRRWSRTTKGSR